MPHVISPYGMRLAVRDDGRKAIVIRTSDRLNFKSCRRKWNWSSHLKGNLGSRHLAQALWFGSAIHYALEDYHGEQHFETASDAFRAYCIASSKQHTRDLPNEANEMLDLGTKMMDYYTDYWLKQPGRMMDPTFRFEHPETGEQMSGVELNFEIEVPLDEHPLLKKYAEMHGADCVLYRGTMDRVAIDEHGRLWVVEYKTAKVAEHFHYETDPQCTTYVWALSHMFPDHVVAGVTYVQFIKNEPKLPAILASGRVSTAANLATSSPLYRKALVNMYGSVEKAPEASRKFLTDLYTKENEDRDRYIVRTKVERNEAQKDAEAQKILLELEDMLNPDLPLYPNPTRTCSRMCSFLSPCVALDAGRDFEGILNDKFSPRDSGPDNYWRRRMPDPKKLAEIRRKRLSPDIEDIQIRVQSLSKQEQEDVERGRAEAEFTFNME